MTIPLMSWPLKDGGVGKAAHGDYAPIVPSSGKRILEWMRHAKLLCEESGLELMTDFFMHERHVIITGMYTYNQHSQKERELIHKLFMALHEESKKRGYGMYRGHVQHMGKKFYRVIYLADYIFRLDCGLE